MDIESLITFIWLGAPAVIFGLILGAFIEKKERKEGLEIELFWPYVIILIISVGWIKWNGPGIFEIEGDYHTIALLLVSFISGASTALSAFLSKHYFRMKYS